MRRIEGSRRVSYTADLSQDRRRAVDVVGIGELGGDFSTAADVQASLIPPYERIARFEVHEQVDWILLVEKEVHCKRHQQDRADVRRYSIRYARRGYWKKRASVGESS